MNDTPVSDIETLLMACQFGDGQFPSGAFGFSWGLEGLVTDGLVGRGDLVPFILGQVDGRWSGFDRVFVAHAHDGAGDEAALCGLDAGVETYSLASAQREGSRRAGAALLGIHARLGTPGAAEFRKLVSAGKTPGHAAVALGLVLAGAGLARGPALALSGYGFVSGLTTAAIRLGIASHIDMQQAISAARPVIAALAQSPVLPIDEVSSFSPLTEIAMMRHGARSMRLFSN
ncbi:urease accessory protein UreF 1 [Skermanella aerolata]|uniref:Urease accessory protein UreF n=1 Tax=Skermanella aerolata TaxID=393310 RepID=A0A512DMU6_9PROT|nr:urease accessory protein UreF 1 [Skermanella aerolata]